ncbi:hypothetical protein MYX76_17580 [Desulfobacterota bacterium AH_259_B03_O07]|nr:hypothetical protein [Desulfobacterota bacterium AH_259_B03_O07]
MDYQEILEKLENFHKVAKKVVKDEFKNQEELDELSLLYGELEEIITQLIGESSIEVPGYRSSYPPLKYKNYIEAGFFSGRGGYIHQSNTQLLKVIGKVRQLAKDPTLPKFFSSITHIIQIIRRFRECCQYIKTPPANEKEVQDILWIMLRSHLDLLEREDTLPTFGIKSYKPDFGIPELRLIVEVKYIGEKKQVSAVQEEILADVPGYLNETSMYDSAIILVYDHAQRLKDTVKFINDLKTVDGILDIIVVPGISFNKI